MTFPTVFVSHGSPDLPLHTGASTDFLKGLGQQLPTPKEILVVSAHWHTPQPTVSSIPQQRAIYDFSGFPGALYQLTYPTPGAPNLATRTVKLLQAAGLEGDTHPGRALDHGAWVPLLMAYPDANIPVTQLSINYNRDPAYHWQLGQAIAPLRQEGVLILASGSITHNLGAFGSRFDAPPPDWVKTFDQWVIQAVTEGNRPALLDYRDRAPYARENHPSDEHLLPLFVALGAAEDSAAELLHNSYIYSAFSMTAFLFR